jgi:hypothetical protein
MSRALRKFVLTAHVVLTVSWLGAVLVFLVLAISGITSKDILLIRSDYLAMELIARFVIVPLSFAPLITGPILSLGTPWGLFRHYWILVKLVITILCTVIMQLHMQPINDLADIAVHVGVFSDDLYKMQIQMVIASSAALIALLITTVLAVYKPRGMTVYGWRKQYQEQAESSNPDN